jgi:hypothetical protein
MVEQALPDSEPTRTPGPSEQAVDVGDDCGGVSPQVLRGVTVPLPIPGYQGAVPFQVVLVDISIAVPCAVVLVDPPSPVDAQVDPGDETAQLVEDLLLWGDRNLSRLVQYSHDRLPSGLAPCVEHRNDLSQ